MARVESTEQAAVEKISSVVRLRSENAPVTAGSHPAQRYPLFDLRQIGGLVSVKRITASPLAVLMS
jgi:hypothetical protein